MVDRVHHHAAHGRADAEPALGASLAQLAQAVLANCRPHRWWRGIRPEPCASRRNAGAAWRNRTRARPAARRQPALRAICAPLPGFISTQCTVVPIGMLRSGRHVAGLDRRVGAGHQTVSPTCDALGRDDVAALAIGVAKQRDVRGAVRIVLDALDPAGDAFLVALEVDDAIVLLVTAATMAHGDAPDNGCGHRSWTGPRSTAHTGRPCAGPRCARVPSRGGPVKSAWVDQCHLHCTSGIRPWPAALRSSGLRPDARRPCGHCPCGYQALKRNDLELALDVGHVHLTRPSRRTSARPRT